MLFQSAVSEYHSELILHNHLSPSLYINFAMQSHESCLVRTFTAEVNSSNLLCLHEVSTNWFVRTVHKSFQNRRRRWNSDKWIPFSLVISLSNVIRRKLEFQRFIYAILIELSSLFLPREMSVINAVHAIHFFPFPWTTMFFPRWCNDSTVLPS